MSVKGVEYVATYTLSDGGVLEVRSSSVFDIPSTYASPSVSLDVIRQKAAAMLDWAVKQALSQCDSTFKKS